MKKVGTASMMAFIVTTSALSLPQVAHAAETQPGTQAGTQPGVPTPEDSTPTAPPEDSGETQPGVDTPVETETPTQPGTTTTAPTPENTPTETAPAPTTGETTTEPRPVEVSPVVDTKPLPSTPTEEPITPSTPVTTVPVTNDDESDDEDLEVEATEVEPVYTPSETSTPVTDQAELPVAPLAPAPVPAGIAGATITVTGPGFAAELSGTSEPVSAGHVAVDTGAGTFSADLDTISGGVDVTTSAGAFSISAAQAEQARALGDSAFNALPVPTQQTIYDTTNAALSTAAAQSDITHHDLGIINTTVVVDHWN
ncbi:hypothetical protein [Corynebacterium callunae]|uniref:hypothetical protein n=1 Tax=Corynebacterium callunae TaxID=1721 RepID=UPI0004A4EF7B|nr:hypothetical protein [Corynebacterium callunae]